ncbi:hypothetical protein HGM15179_005972 [Zosterops borbonicus]|uniref:Integrase catalytic domain-containing protein n=1 Tax=Zosterops borbonicus TaxID=364589 RepID=A0A8K1GLC3_9PASS|nr:hypothetical protein HGM15179_005972 [Zosterops borbonicus]
MFLQVLGSINRRKFNSKKCWILHLGRGSCGCTDRLGNEMLESNVMVWIKPEDLVSYKCESDEQEEFDCNSQTRGYSSLWQLHGYNSELAYSIQILPIDLKQIKMQLIHLLMLPERLTLHIKEVHVIVKLWNMELLMTITHPKDPHAETLQSPEADLDEGLVFQAPVPPSSEATLETPPKPTNVQLWWLSIVSFFPHCPATLDICQKDEFLRLTPLIDKHGIDLKSSQISEMFLGADATVKTVNKRNDSSTGIRSSITEIKCIERGKLVSLNVFVELVWIVVEKSMKSNDRVENVTESTESSGKLSLQKVSPEYFGNEETHNDYFSGCHICCVLTIVKAAIEWVETYPVPHTAAHNTILDLEKQVLSRLHTPERIESDNGTHFKNSPINT